MSGVHCIRFFICFSFSRKIILFGNAAHFIIFLTHNGKGNQLYSQHSANEKYQLFCSVIPKRTYVSCCVSNAVRSAAALRSPPGRTNRRLTRNESRYHSGKCYIVCTYMNAARGLSLSMVWWCSIFL